MIIAIASGNLGRDARIVRGEHSNFLAFSIGVKGSGDDTQWIECIYGYRGENPPAVFDRLKKGKFTVVRGRVYARVIPPTENYPDARPQLNMSAEVVECPGTNREIQGPDETRKVEDAPTGTEEPNEM